MNDKTYFILSREIFSSAIWLDNPHILKLFIYLIGNARYKEEPKKYPHFQVNRGEVLTSLHDLSEANEYVEFGKVQKWSRAKVSRMLQTLEKQGYIKTISDTYGTHISICNYNTYQEQARYISDRPDTVPNNSENTLQTPCKQGEHNSKKVKQVKNDKKEKTLVRFEEFWNLYPSRNGKKLEKGKAMDAYAKIKESDIPSLIQAVSNYARSEMVRREIGIKDPKRFLIDGKGNPYWREWIEPEKATKDLSVAERMEQGRGRL